MQKYFYKKIFIMNILAQKKQNYVTVQYNSHFKQLAFTGGCL